MSDARNVVDTMHKFSQMCDAQIEQNMREVVRVIDQQLRRIEALDSERTMLRDSVDAQRTIIYRQKARILYLESIVAQLRKEGAA